MWWSITKSPAIQMSQKSTTPSYLISGSQSTISQKVLITIELEKLSWQVVSIDTTSPTKKFLCSLLTLCILSLTTNALSKQLKSSSTGLRNLWQVLRERSCFLFMFSLAWITFWDLMRYSGILNLLKGLLKSWQSIKKRSFWPQVHIFIERNSVTQLVQTFQISASHSWFRHQCRQCTKTIPGTQHWR